jgi:hypothetical protein
MIALRLFDSSRHPANWTEIIRAGQYAAFSKRAATGAPCDADGDSFATTDDATCLLFDALEDARVRVDGAGAARIVSVVAGAGGRRH